MHLTVKMFCFGTERHRMRPSRVTSSRHSCTGSAGSPRTRHASSQIRPVLSTGLLQPQNRGPGSIRNPFDITVGTLVTLRVWATETVGAAVVPIHQGRNQWCQTAMHGRVNQRDPISATACTRLGQSGSTELMAFSTTHGSGLAPP